MDRKTYLLIAIIIVGIYLLGAGMSGLVVSQTCCFPPNCAQENLCPVAKPAEVPGFNSLSLLLFIVGAYFAVFAVLNFVSRRL